jgi:predicted AlkP superfamily phosphohydrolase/phosphomutase/tetratricopeptide (TPR) repeat protein
MSESACGKKVLLIGWDAADWKFITPLLDNGLLPNLAKMIDGGVMANLASLRPCLSPILWTSIATGKTADKHGITGFVEPVPGGGGIRLSSSTSRKTKAIWNILSQNGLRSVVINWYASHPAEPILGICISSRFFEGIPKTPQSPWAVVPESVHPAELEPHIAGLRMHPAEFSLKDMERFIPRISEIDLSLDPRPRRLAELLARTVSVHSIATGAMEAEPWDFLAVYLDGLDVAGHQFMPFHPPHCRSVSQNDFELYQHVMREMYLFHDEMLGRLLELAGENTTVILLSDHGFHSNHLRPQHPQDACTEDEQAAQWHRHYGILAMKGPELLCDERIYGANLLDIAPTILALFGLPIGRDMPGQPLRQALANPTTQVAAIPSWDLVPGRDGMQRSNSQHSMMESPEVVAQLVSLGYLPAETAESAKAVASAIAESQFNLAIVHSSHGRQPEAQSILEGLSRSYCDNNRYALALAKTYANQQMYNLCLDTLAELESRGFRSLECDLLFAAGLFNSGHPSDAILRLKNAESEYSSSPALFRVAGEVYLQQKAWESACDAFSKCLQLDDEEPHAHHGFAMASLKLGRYEQACDHALQAIGLLFFFPQAHFHMGLALKGLGDTTRAIRSLNLAVSQAPRLLEAHQELALLYEQTNNVTLWMEHQRLGLGLPT